MIFAISAARCGFGALTSKHSDFFHHIGFWRLITLHLPVTSATPDSTEGATDDGLRVYSYPVALCYPPLPRYKEQELNGCKHLKPRS